MLRNSFYTIFRRGPLMADAIVHSAIYDGWIRHRRFHDKPHEFRYEHGLLYLDIDEIPAVFSSAWFTGHERRAPVSWRRKYFLHPLEMTLRDAVNHHLNLNGLPQASGAIRVLSSPTLLGLCFNPVSFYYCFDAHGSRVEYILAEINNTPWDERHTYVIDARNAAHAGREDLFRTRFAKIFHVSPFHPMTHDYTWTMTSPGEALRIHMDNHEAGEKRFDATLVMERKPLDRANLARYAFRRWPTSWHTLAGIYWQAARLYLKGATFYDHPRSRSPSA